MQKKKHIVFFTPTLQKTGSEIVLFNLINFAVNYFEITVITKYKGELYNALPKKITKHYLYYSQSNGIVAKFFNRLRKFFVVPALLKKYKNQIWYINTILMTDILKFAKENEIKTIVHIHELQQMYDLLSTEEINLLTQYPDCIIANSKASQNIVMNFGRTKHTQIIYPCLNFSNIKISKPNLRKDYNFDNDFVWLMSGTLDSNKNPFLFVDIAHELKKSNQSFKMVWLGNASSNNNIVNQFESYIIKKKCSDVIVWINEPSDNYYDYFNMANGFVLTSKLESFSLVTLEAIYLGLPVVANNCVGVSEILENKFGYVSIEKSNVTEMVDAMLKYMNNEILFNKKTLMQRALQFDSNIIGEEWIETLNKFN